MHENQAYNRILNQNLGAKVWAQYYPEYFAYAVTVAVSVAGGATPSNTGNVRVDVDGAFIITEVSCQSFNAAFSTTLSTGVQAATLNSNQRVQIVDSGSGKAFFSQPIPIASFGAQSNLAGGWGLPAPRIIARNGTLQITVTNSDATNAWTNDFVFHGFKMLPRSVIEGYIFGAVK